MFTAPDGYSWQWYNTDGAIDGATSQTFTAEEGITYWCVVTSEFNCTSTTDTVMFIGINETEDEEILLFPNPMTDAAVMVIPAKFAGAHLKITDEAGRLVQDLGTVISNQFIIHRSSLAAGNYFIQLSANGVVMKNLKLVMQ